MCGIAGIVSPDSAVRADVRVRGMLERLAHRGPDDEGVWRGAGATIGVRRLSVIDVGGGHQPMVNEDGSIVAVQNGEIYNFSSLREALTNRGHALRTRSDTEVLPHAYEEYGETFVTRLRGMFALAVWDEPRSTLTLARDRVGKKPLFYVHQGDTLVFASEIQALLSLPDVPRDVDDAAIAEYLAFGYVPAPRSAFASIRKIEPGHVLTFQRGVIRTWRYWQPQFEPKSSLSFDAAAEQLRSLIDDAVRVRLISDVPLGVLLSGGLDSSTVVAFMARHAARPLRTFSIGFNEASFDELRYARTVARHFGTEHHEFKVEPSAIEVVPVLTRHFGEPFADSSAIPTYYVAKIAREYVTVVLNGDGGDELFAGYDRYKAIRLAGMLDYLPAASSVLQGVLGVVPGRLRRHRRVARMCRLLSAVSSDPDERFFRWTGYFVGSRGDDIYGPRTKWARPENRYFSQAADMAGARDLVDRALAADLLTSLPGDLLVKMDIATMGNSLEARSPLLDHEVIDFVSRLPASYKSSLWTSKRLLRHAMKNELPAEILGRGKMGFSVPVGSWLRGPLRDLLQDVLLAPSALSTGYVERSGVEALVRDHLEYRIDRTPQLWSLLMLEIWFRECVRAPRTSSVAARPLPAL